MYYFFLRSPFYIFRELPVLRFCSVFFFRSMSSFSWSSLLLPQRQRVSVVGVYPSCKRVKNCLMFLNSIVDLSTN